jgi:hypothetical protein
MLERGMQHGLRALIFAGRPTRLRRVWRSTLATWKTLVFFLKVLPMLPSRALNLVTPEPVVKSLRYPTHAGWVEGDLYRPSKPGPHPGLVMCLGVIPIDVDHPQVPRLGEALARAGFAALLYWSPAMRDRRLDPVDIEDIASAYDQLIDQPYIDPQRSGLFGTCVGGAFVLMAAADERIRDRVRFVGTFAPFSSMWTLTEDIASASRLNSEVRIDWPVDQLTRAVYVRTLTDALSPEEASALRGEPEPVTESTSVERSALGRRVERLLEPISLEQARSMFRELPNEMQERLTQMSPITYIDDIHAPLVIISHDRDDTVVPVSESRQLYRAFNGRDGLYYTEFAMFQHADPTKRKLAPRQLVRELSRFFTCLYPMFRASVEV